MEEILEKLDEWENVDEIKEIAEKVLERDLTNEELALLQDEDDDFIENLTKEIYHKLEDDVPEEEKESFYDNHIDLLEYSKNDDEKLKRIASIKTPIDALYIISSIKDNKNQITAVNLLNDDFKKFVINRLGKDFLKEYIKSPNKTISNNILEDLIIQTKDTEILKDYIRNNQSERTAYLIQTVGESKFTKECLEDENIIISRRDRLEIIGASKDTELSRNALFDDELRLTNYEKINLLHNVNDIGLLSSYIHDEACTLNESEIKQLIKNTGNINFIKDSILDASINLGRKERIKLIDDINNDLSILREILDSPELNLDIREKASIVEKTKNIPFIEEFLEREHKNLDVTDKYKLLHTVESDSQFIEQLLREYRIIEGSQNRLEFTLKLGKQDLIKESVYDRRVNWIPSEIVKLISSVEDEEFIVSCFQDKQIDLQWEQINIIIKNSHLSEQNIKRCILDPKINLSDEERFNCLLENVADCRFIMDVVKESMLNLDNQHKFELLTKKLKEPFISENIDEFMEFIKENGGDYKSFREKSECPEGIFNNIDRFLEAENVDAKEIQVYKERLSRMYIKNQEVISKIDFSLLDSKYIDTLGEDKINQISCYPEIQERILGMDNKMYDIFCSCLNYRSTKSERWTGFANDIIENLISGEYDELIQNCDLENINIENLSNLLQSKNIFNIKYPEEVDNIDTIRRKICDSIMNNTAIEGEILDSFSDIDKKRFAVLEKIFGQDIDKSQAIISAYGENIEDIADKEENKEIVDYVKTIKIIMQEDNEDILRKMYDEAETIGHVDIEIMQSKLNSAYCEKLNEGLFQITEDTKKVGENIYEAGTEFNMIITSVAAFHLNQPENYAEDWNKNLISTQHFCTNYIRNDMMGRAPMPHLCYGFSSMKNDSLMMCGAKDLISGESEMKISSIVDNKFSKPDSLINETVIYNELDFARYQGGEKKQPDYIVVFRKDGEIPNWDNALKAQKQWGDLPIVIVDEDKCLENEKNKVNDLLDEYEESADSTKLENALQKIRNNRVTDSEFCEDIDIQEMQEQLAKARCEEKNNSETKEKLVGLDDLEHNYKIVNAIDRKQEAGRISQIYKKIRQTQIEGERNEL